MSREMNDWFGGGPRDMTPAEQSWHGDGPRESAGSRVDDFGGAWTELLIMMNDLFAGARDQDDANIAAMAYGAPVRDRDVPSRDDR